MADIKIFTPASYLGNIIELCTKKRGKQTDLQYRTNSVEISFNIPLSEIIYDFFDNLKSLSKGYASYDYVITDYVESEMIRLDILVNKKRIDALSQIMHKDDHYRKARATIDNLKTLIPRQMFEINIQGCIGAKVIASTSIKGFRKDVTAKLYGGDVTRKMKLLQKQKEGKRKMKKIGNVEIPKECDYAYKAFKKTILSSFADEEKLKTQLDLVSQDIENGLIFEFAGLHYMKNENYVSAEEAFNKALKLDKDSTSLLRLKIHLAYAMNDQGNKKSSLKILNDLSKEYSGSMEADAVDLIIKNIKAGK